jgi:GNAT superfamily N-acetyltransferase
VTLKLGKDKITAVRLLALGVLREYRRFGLEAFLYLKMREENREQGYVDCELSWILEDNRLAANGIERIGGKIYKTYRLYRGDL